MKKFYNSVLFLLLWMFYGTDGQASSFYHHDFYPIAASPPYYYRRSNGFEPITYRRDLITDESKHKVSPKKYSKSISNRPSYPSEEEDISSERFHSAEFSNESRGFGSAEQDSREFAIGTQIHVQHPITVPKKITSSHPRPTKQSAIATAFNTDADFSGEIPSPDNPSALPLKKKRPSKFTRHYDGDPFHVIPPPKSTSTAIAASSSNGYNVYEADADIDDYKSSKKSYQRYKDIASKKQIEQYIEDQQKKLLDEALKIQILNNQEFKQFLKQKEKKRQEREHRQIYREDDDIISPPSPPPSVFLENLEQGVTFTTSRPRRRPSDFKRSPKRNVPFGGKPKRKYRSAVVIEV